MMIETGSEQLPTLMGSCSAAADTHSICSVEEASEVKQVPIPSSYGVGRHAGRPTLGRDVTVCISTSKPKVWVSIKLHDVTHLDMSTQQFGAFFELDFKYEVAEMLREVPPSFFDLESASGPIEAASCKFPWIISNMVEFDLIRENHFFKSVMPRTTGEDGLGEATSGPPVSIYGGCDQVSSRWSSPDKEAPGRPTGRVFKCEQYVMRGIFKFYTVEYLWPWAGAWFVIKVATDERPGAELLQLLPHRQDSTYPAFEASTIYGFVPKRKKSDPGAGFVPDVNYAIMRSKPTDKSSQSCPRMYMITAARRKNAVEDWLKFYLMPFLSNVFVLQYDFDESDNFVSILATLILAYIALLFTLPPTSSLVFAEQNVLMSMVIVLICGYLSYTHSVDHDILAAVNVAALFVVTVGQWLWARYTNHIVDRAVESSDWAAIASYF